MSAKDKRQQLIKEILHSAGVLDSGAIKERVCARLGLAVEDYPKATYLRHLKELVDENQIIQKNSFGKNTYHLPEASWEVIGQKYLENLGHRVFVPRAILTAGVKIVPGYYFSDETNEMTILMDLGVKYFSLVVDKSALPFNLHVSRTQVEFQKPEIITQFGKRTIFLEVMMRKVSGYKQDEQKKNGHVLLSFLANGSVALEDLGSTHGTFCMGLTADDCEEIERIANEPLHSTSRRSGLEAKTIVKKTFLPLQEFTPTTYSLPLSVKCSDDFTLSLIN